MTIEAVGLMRGVAAATDFIDAPLALGWRHRYWRFAVFPGTQRRLGIAAYAVIGGRNPRATGTLARHNGDGFGHLFHDDHA
jgi:hypothetical protein